MLTFQIPQVSAIAGPNVAEDLSILNYLTPEAGALQHWVFGSDGLLGGLDMIGDTEVDPVTDDPTVHANYISMALGSSGNLKGLKSAMDDSAGSMTVALVAKRPADAANQTVAGTSTSTAGDGGSLLFWSSTLNKLQLNIRPLASGFFPTVDPGEDLEPGGWYFAAFSHAPSVHTLLLGGVGSDAKTGAKTVSANKVALGDGYWDANGFRTAIDAAEFMVWNTPLSLAEMQAVYARSKQRMAARGITIL
jgi:hypothetical protein